MTFNDIRCSSGFYSWTEYRERATQAQIWTENGYRIDGANRGDRHDNGITVYRPAFIPRTHRGKRLRDLCIYVSTEDRQTITGIIATYGRYPETITQEYSGDALKAAQ